MAHIAHGTCRAWSAYRAWHIHGGKVSLTYESSFLFNGNIRQKISFKERVHAKDAIYQISKKVNFSKTWYFLSKMTLITPVPLTPAPLTPLAKIAGFYSPNFRYIVLGCY